MHTRLTRSHLERIVSGRMALSPTARHRLDKALLGLTAVAVLVPLVWATDRAAGASGPVWLTRVICGLVVLAQIVRWLKRQHAAHRSAVAGLVGLASFVGVLFALADPGVDDLAHLVGRIVVLFGVPALVVWKLDPETYRRIWRERESSGVGSVQK